MSTNKTLGILNHFTALQKPPARAQVTIFQGSKSGFPESVKFPLGETEFTKEIRCENSGILLGHLRVMIVEGHLTYVQSYEDSVFLHPFYGLNSVVLVKKLEDSLHRHQEASWNPGDREKERLRLLCSALMHNLGCIRQQEPSLPKHEIAAASASRLLSLAKWFFYISSQRLAFPTYSVSPKNANLQWENFKYWLDSAFEIRKNWASTVQQRKEETLKRAEGEALKELKSAHSRPSERKKIWGWIEVQLRGHEPEGRIQTFKEIFLDGDLNAGYWLKQDVEDLQFSLAQHCDIDNEFNLYIRERLRGIKSLIHDFNSSFTLLTKVQQDKFGSDEQTPQEKEFFKSYDETAGTLEAMPPEPERKNFATNALWFQAKARWDILGKRWKQMQEEKAANGEKPKQVLEEQLVDDSEEDSEGDSI